MNLNLTCDGTYLCDKHLEAAGDTCEAVTLTVAMTVEHTKRDGAAPACAGCISDADTSDEPDFERLLELQRDARAWVRDGDEPREDGGL